MADAVSTIIDEVIAREGGFVNDGIDAGSATKYGITIATLQEWRRKPTSVDDVRNLTVEETREIYRVRFFQATGFDQIRDPQIQRFCFDFAVNSGERASVMALQRCIGVKADGAFGPVSSAALKAINNLGMLFYALKSERYELLLRYVGIDPRQSIYANGWSNRLDQFEEKIT